MRECWNCGLVPPDPPGDKEGSRAGFIRNSPKTYRRIDSIEGHRLPLDAHMTGGEGRRPGARGGVAVVVLLAFLVLAERENFVTYLRSWFLQRVSYFDIFAIFGGTVYPSWDCLRRAKQARSPRPRPRAPVSPPTGLRALAPDVSVRVLCGVTTTRTWQLRWRSPALHRSSELCSSLSL